MGKIDSQLGRSLEHKLQLHSARDYMDGIIRQKAPAGSVQALASYVGVGLELGGSQTGAVDVRKGMKEWI